MRLRTVTRLAVYEAAKTIKKRNSDAPRSPRKPNVHRLFNRKLTVTPTAYPATLALVSLALVNSFIPHMTARPISVLATPTRKNLKSELLIIEYPFAHPMIEAVRMIKRPGSRVKTAFEDQAREDSSTSDVRLKSAVNSPRRRPLSS
jgi:hypothetical protein